VDSTGFGGVDAVGAVESGEIIGNLVLVSVISVIVDDSRADCLLGSVGIELRVELGASFTELSNSARTTVRYFAGNLEFVGVDEGIKVDGTKVGLAVVGWIDGSFVVCVG
jgi:hypothetical protein